MPYTTINKSTDYFNTKLYTGTGSTHNVTGVGFQPNWVWIKSRSDAYSHYLFDVVRGATKQIQSNLTDPEATSANQLTSFDSDGFTLGTDIVTNGSSKTFASWNWLASNTTASNTDGSITSTVSANTTAGFSIVSYTGTGSNATVGHGLSAVPKMIIVKNRDNVDNWTVYHGTQGGTKVQWLNLTNATATESGWWNNTDPTSSVFYIGTQNGVNKSGDNLIAYCFAEKKGYSKFGSYTGNGNADGAFVYTGFKPAMVIIKKTSGVDNWTIYDNKRDGFNGDTHALFPNLTDVQTTDVDIDLVSNGFKIVRVSDRVNQNGQTFIYMAFGQSLVGSNNVPCTAR